MRQSPNFGNFECHPASISSICLKKPPVTQCKTLASPPERRSPSVLRCSRALRETRNEKSGHQAIKPSDCRLGSASRLNLGKKSKLPPLPSSSFSSPGLLWMHHLRLRRNDTQRRGYVIQQKGGTQLLDEDLPFEKRCF